jgi:NAD(P)-dependent dehydrogenase (short-subunit alcohol dehydrogenase family)
VTGGARGLGAAIAAKLAKEGAIGSIFDQLGTASTELPTTWTAFEVDVRDGDALRRAFEAVREQFGDIDVVVANAGVVPPWTSTVDIDIAEWDRVLSINATGVMLTIREAVRVMNPGGGSIVAMSSLNGWRGDPNIASYVASKHAVVGIVRSVALDVGRLGIRVNAVGPGPVATDALLDRMTERSDATGLSVAEALRRANEATALRRIATVDEIANAVLFLASDDSSGITGHLLPVDAGIL